MTYAEVKELISIINTSVLTNFELNMDNVSIKMSKNKEAINSQTIQHTISEVQTSPNENNRICNTYSFGNNNGTKW